MVERLIGKDDVVRTLAGKVGNRQGDLALGPPIRLKSPVAVAQQHEHVAEIVADEQVEVAVAVAIVGGQARGQVAGAVDGFFGETAVAVPEEDRQVATPFIQDGQI